MKQSANNDFACDECGAEVHPNSRSCGSCGAKAGSARKREAVPSWHQPEHLDGVDMPALGDEADETFDYDDFVAREFGTTNRKALGDPLFDWKKVFWWVTAVVTFIAFTWMVMRFW